MYDGLWWIFGGHAVSQGPMNIAKAYNFDADKWLAKPRPGGFDSWTHQGAAVVEVDGQKRIYKLGGRINRQLTDAV